MANVLLFGAGSVGSCYLYLLAKAGAKTTAVCRSNYAEVKAHGFTINSAIWGTVTTNPAVIRTISEAASQQWDYVIVASKAYPGSKPTTAETIAPAVGPKTTIVLLQNGIGIEDEYTALFPSNPLVSAVVYLPVTQTAQGVVRMGNLERLELGTYPSVAPAAHKDAAQAFADLLKKAGGSAVLYDDVQPRRWSKLLVNASWNPICALSRSSDVEYMNASTQSTDVVLGVMLELVELANVMGYDEINEKEARFQLSRATDRIPDKGIEPSMLADIWTDRPMEVEAIVGNAVRLAEQKDVKTPGLTMLYCLLKALDDSNARKRLKARV